MNNIKFDNREFWDNRYSSNLELGSGVGSRGKHRDDKKRFLTESLERYKPTSVLDVGCGDLEVTRDIDFPNYTGIDISDFIIRRNKEKYPNRRFLCGDFLDLLSHFQLNADLVICLDVLIHQHDYEKYLKFVKELVKCSNKIGIISGFDHEPAREYSSKITAYHEPITLTLDRNVKNLMKLGNYRDIDIVLFIK